MTFTKKNGSAPYDWLIACPRQPVKPGLEKDKNKGQQGLL